MQDPTYSQSLNRYSYCVNNPLKYVDENGYWFGLDDIIVSAVGFVVGYVSYGVTKGDWGWKAVVTGLACAAIAELGYLTLGGGLAITTTGGVSGGGAIATGGGCMYIGTGTKVAFGLYTAFTSVGGAGTLGAALTYSATFAVYSAINIAQHYDQIKNANDFWAGLLITGYAANAALSAGFQSDFMAGSKEKVGVIDKFLGISNEAIRGFLSYGIGGALSNGSNEILNSYDSKYNTWSFDGVRVLKQMVKGFFTSGTSRILGNYYDKIGYNYLKDNNWLGYSAIMGVKAVSFTANSTAYDYIFMSHTFDPFNSDNLKKVGNQWLTDLVRALMVSK